MPNVILDTNVVVSALVFGGRISKILQMALEQNFQLYTCQELEEEVLRILVTKFGASLSQLQTAQEILKIGTQIVIQKPYPEKIRDEKDRYLLALATVCHADFLISGDKDLLTLSNYQSTKIVSPRDFLNLWE